MTIALCLIHSRGGSYAVNVLEQVVATFNTQMLYEEVSMNLAHE